jgi:DMSO/TMAO reductase YedYZ molybdopterin-dependent catalytic subunit
MTISGKDSRLILYGDTNLGMPLDLIDSLVVPNDLFFVRSNGPTPEIDPATWRLNVDGAVERVLNLSLDDLKALPYRTITSFLECAGNSRSRLVAERRRRSRGLGRHVAEKRTRCSRRQT